MFKKFRVFEVRETAEAFADRVNGTLTYDYEFGTFTVVW